MAIFVTSTSPSKLHLVFFMATYKKAYVQMQTLIKESNVEFYIQGNSIQTISDNLIRLISDDKILEEYSFNARKYIQNRSPNLFLSEI